MKKKFNLLLVDDSEMDQRLIEKIVGNEEINVVKAFSGSQALELLQQYQVFLILQDINIPETNGYEIAEKIKECSQFRDIPIIFITSLEESSLDTHKGYEIGAADFIFKPVDAIKLKSKVGIFLSLFKKHYENYTLVKAMEQLSESVMITNKNGVIEYVNPVFEQKTGYRKEEVLNGKPSILKSGKQGRTFYSKIWETIISGKSWKGDLINRKKDGTFIEESIIISPISDESGKIINFVSVSRDFSEQKKLINQLNHAQKMEAIGTLAAGIAHEINTPMQYIMDNTIFIKKSLGRLLSFIDSVRNMESEFSENDSFETLFKRIREIEKMKKIPFTEDEIPDSIQDTLDGIERVRKLVLAMKDFSHPGKIDKGYSNINKAIDSTIVITRNVWKYCADLEYDFDKTLPNIYCSIDDVNQVFLNMIVNASDAIKEKQSMKLEREAISGEKGKITIRTKNLKNSVLITISDTGSGIPQTIINKIYEPFFTTKPIGKGTGQGLAISHDVIVNKHNGELDVNSVIGEGTTFTIKLPIQKVY